MNELSQKDFALKLHDWHGGQHTGVYSIASCLLADPHHLPEQRTVERAVAELERFGGEADARVERETVVAEIKRRFAPVPPLDDFTRAYITCALWSSTDDNDDPLDEHFNIGCIAPETLAGIIKDCADFQSSNGLDIEAGPLRETTDGDYSRAGHDFWLTRNGHGAGFWDGDWPEPAASRLTESAQRFKGCDLYVGDDGKLHI
jgi:hypothetical protein